jgi:hypothetical protein
LTQADNNNMDDTAYETLQNALSHHNEWEGQNIMLSVNQSPDLDELADVDLAQCLGKAHGARLQHEKLGDKVRVNLCSDITACSSLDLRVLVTALLASDIPMLEHSSVGDGASSTPGTNVSIAGARANAPRLVDAFYVCHDFSCLSCSLLRGKSREHGISVHHGDDVCGFRSL